MIVAQGLRPLDPYRSLQLDPRAPRELIVEAHWALVSRTRRGDAQSSAASDEMSAAYALLMDDEQRRQYDAGHPASVHAAADHYAALYVDAEADAGIIDAAYSFLSREQRRRKRSERQAADEAYRILSNAQLRAQYDAAREAARRGASPELALVAPNEHHPERGTPARVVAAKQKRQGLFGRASRVVLDAAPDAADARLLGLRGAALASMPEPAIEPRQEIDTNTEAVAEIVFIAGPQAGERVALDGSTVTLGGSFDDGVMLMGVVRPECASVWQHGERFMLREADGAGMLVCGRPLALPVVVLDDGDEIAVGRHRLRFRRIPAG